jgi:hypothetical protein
MPRRIALEPHCTQDELEARHRPARDPVERSRWRFLWLLARGLTATNAHRPGAEAGISAARLRPR